MGRLTVFALLAAVLLFGAADTANLRGAQRELLDDSQAEQIAKAVKGAEDYADKTAKFLGALSNLPGGQLADNLKVLAKDLGPYLGAAGALVDLVLIFILTPATDQQAKRINDGFTRVDSQLDSLRGVVQGLPDAVGSLIGLQTYANMRLQLPNVENAYNAWVNSAVQPFTTAVDRQHKKDAALGACDSQDSKPQAFMNYLESSILQPSAIADTSLIGQVFEVQAAGDVKVFSHYVQTVLADAVRAITLIGVCAALRGDSAASRGADVNAASALLYSLNDKLYNATIAYTGKGLVRFLWNDVDSLLLAPHVDYPTLVQQIDAVVNTKYNWAAWTVVVFNSGAKRPAEYDVSSHCVTKDHLDAASAPFGGCLQALQYPNAEGYNLVMMWVGTRYIRSHFPENQTFPEVADPVITSVLGPCNLGVNLNATCVERYVAEDKNRIQGTFGAVIVREQNTFSVSGPDVPATGPASLFAANSRAFLDNTKMNPVNLGFGSDGGFHDRPNGAVVVSGYVQPCGRGALFAQCLPH